MQARQELSWPGYLAERSPYGQNAFLAASKSGRTNIMKQLDKMWSTDSGVVNNGSHRRNPYGFRLSALHWAALKGHVHAVEYLLSIDQSLKNERDLYGNTACARARIEWEASDSAGDLARRLLTIQAMLGEVPPFLESLNIASAPVEDEPGQYH